jgi:Lrp/AsnC family transcriptional regulator, regulator for asnA, asnC and gidA
MNYEIDDLDREILRRLQADGRAHFLDLARELRVSGGTIHSRVNKMKAEGVITGAKVVVDPAALGFGVCAFVGIILSKAGLSAKTRERLKAIPEIVEVHYTTGTYSLLAKVVVRTIPDLYALLSQKLQGIEAIQSTETFVILDTSVDRDLML